MYRLAVIAAILSFTSTTACADEDKKMITVLQSGDKPSIKGSPDYFTGSVRIDSSFQGEAPARIGGATVTFEPSSRTAWHTHPLGQTLIVVSGLGLVQEWGGPTRKIKQGDIVWIPAGVKHWHGASSAVAMSHIAIAEALDGKVVEWMEHVTEEQYPSTM